MVRFISCSNISVSDEVMHCPVLFFNIALNKMVGDSENKLMNGTILQKSVHILASADDTDITARRMGSRIN